MLEFVFGDVGPCGHGELLEEDLVVVLDSISGLLLECQERTEFDNVGELCDDWRFPADLVVLGTAVREERVAEVDVRF